MIFHSTEFIIFLVVTFAAYWCLRHRAQNALLLAASAFFYGFVHLWFLLPLAASILVDFSVTQAMERFPVAKRRLLWLSLVSNLGVLGVFKYHGFFVENVRAMLTSVGLPNFAYNLEIFLPIGISFYTLQALSYVIDVYRGRLRARSHLGDFALYILFFPQLVAGPIERATRLLPQIERPRTFDLKLARDGLYLMIWGFFKKLVIADNVAVICNKVFATEATTFPLLWAGVVAFCIQVFADFSAYTDIARGTSRLLGIELMENFRHPYLARSPIEFWRRWHVSLSEWIRDYIYIPLGGSRAGLPRRVANVLAAFLISGLWHGPSWNFVLWGAYWGILVALQREGSWLARFIPERVAGSGAVAIAQTSLMFMVTTGGWLLFRETDTEYLWTYLTLSPFGQSAEDWRFGGYLVTLVALYSTPLAIHALWDLKIAARVRSVPRPAVVGWLGRSATAAAMLVGVAVLHSPIGSDFIYFQF